MFTFGDYECFHFRNIFPIIILCVPKPALKSWQERCNLYFVTKSFVTFNFWSLMLKKKDIRHVCSLHLSGCGSKPACLLFLLVSLVPKTGLVYSTCDTSPIATRHGRGHGCHGNEVVIETRSSSNSAWVCSTRKRRRRYFPLFHL